MPTTACRASAHKVFHKTQITDHSTKSLSLQFTELWFEGRPAVRNMKKESSDKDVVKASRPARGALALSLSHLAEMLPVF